MAPIDATDRRLIQATQGGLPLVAAPYQAVARMLDISEAEVIKRLSRMLDAGIIRRVGAVPNHYRLGYRHNGMTVWQVDEADLEACGTAVGALPFVTHCYHRPPHPPLWPYTLFAMIHARDADTAESYVQTIRRTLGGRCRAGQVLYSRRILKKTGFRLSAPSPSPEGMP